MDVLLIDHDEDHALPVREALREGDSVHVVARADLVAERGEFTKEGRSLMESVGRFDAVLFPWDFRTAPVLNALTHGIRERLGGPSVALCEPAQEAEALAAGADAVLYPPVDMARLEALAFAHRRLVQVTAGAVSAGAPAPWKAALPVSVGGLTVDPSSLRAVHGEREARLTPRETALLGYLVRQAGRVCSREELLDRVWGIRFDTGTNMVDVYVHFVRRRLEAIGWPFPIETVRGAGYRLSVPPDRTATTSPSESAR